MTGANAVRISAAVLVLGSVNVLAQQTGQDAVHQFETRIVDYVKLRDSQGKLPTRPAASAAQLAAKRKELAAKVRDSRTSAKEGEVFAPPVGEFFKKKIEESFAGPHGPRIRASLRHAEPVHGIKLAINESYPQGLPLQSTPPSLLLNLPAISQGLQYRIVGRDLVLLDTNTNLIVDVLRDAIPTEDSQ